MAIIQLSGEDIKHGWSGLTDDTSNIDRVQLAASKSFFVVNVVGTGCKVKLFQNSDGNTPNGMVEYSIEGAAWQTSTVNAGFYEVFTGLSDINRLVVFRINAAYGTSAFLKLSQADAVEAEGAAPEFNLYATSFTQLSTGLTSSAYTIDSPVGFLPSKSFNKSGAYDFSSAHVIFTTSSTDFTAVITPNNGFVGDIGLLINVDGAPPVRVQSVGSVATFTLPAGLKTVSIRGEEYGFESIYCADLSPIGARLDQFGDSITQGVGTAFNGYVDINNVADSLGRLGQTYGLAGWTVADLHTNIQDIVDNSPTTAGDMAVLAIGRNSTAELETAPTQLQYKEILDVLFAAGYEKVLARGILPEGAEKWVAANAGIESVVDAYVGDVTFIDTSLWSGIATQDGTHPSIAGYGQIEAYALPAYTPIVGPPPGAPIFNIEVSGMPDGSYLTAIRSDNGLVDFGSVAYVDGKSVLPSTDTVGTYWSGLVTDNNSPNQKGSHVKGTIELS